MDYGERQLTDGLTVLGKGHAGRIQFSGKLIKGTILGTTKVDLEESWYAHVSLSSNMYLTVVILG